MPSDLCVPVFRGCTFLKVHPLENGILPKLLFDGKHGLLYPLFLRKLFIFLLPLGIECRIISEEVKLLKISVC